MQASIFLPPVFIACTLNNMQMPNIDICLYICSHSLTQPSIKYTSNIKRMPNDNKKRRKQYKLLSFLKYPRVEWGKMYSGAKWVFFIFYTKSPLKVHSQVWDDFWQLKALWKRWKMLFISPQKLYSFSRHLTFCLDFFGRVAKRLDYKDKAIFKIYEVTAWLTSNCNTHIAQYLEK